MEISTVGLVFAFIFVIIPLSLATIMVCACAFFAVREMIKDFND